MIIFAICTLSVLIACSSSAVEANDDELSEEYEIETIEDVSSDFVKEFENISEDTVIEKYQEFNEFISFWYNDGNSEAVTEEIIKYNNKDYCRYETSDIENFKDFENAVLALMTDELWQELQLTCEYIDRDGALYGPITNTSAVQTVYADSQFEVTQISEKFYELVVYHYFYATTYVNSYSIDEEILFGISYFNFEYVDENWIFTAYLYESVNTIEG